MKKLLIIALALMMTVLSACAQLDVIAKDSVRAFGEVSGDMDVSEDSGAWHITAPDGTTSLTLGATYASIQLDAQPFYDAGLSGDYKFEISTSITEVKGSNGSPSAVLEYIVKNDRNLIGYHTALDHYNIDLGGGNMFEWAKDVSTNDKDVVFVLNPEPLIAAGVDPEKVEGWVFAKVPVEVDGKPAEVDKFLKPFDLK